MSHTVVTPVQQQHQKKKNKRETEEEGEGGGGCQQQVPNAYECARTLTFDKIAHVHLDSVVTRYQKHKPWLYVHLDNWSCSVLSICHVNPIHHIVDEHMLLPLGT